MEPLRVYVDTFVFGGYYDVEFSVCTAPFLRCDPHRGCDLIGLRYVGRQDDRCTGEGTRVVAACVAALRALHADLRPGKSGANVRIIDVFGVDTTEVIERGV